MLKQHVELHLLVHWYRLCVEVICAVYGDNAIEENTVRKWYSRFKEDRFDIGDTPRSGRPSGMMKVIETH